MAERELILIAGVEGGGVTLYGNRTATGWTFHLSYADQTGMLLQEAEAEPEIRRDASRLATWEAALDALDAEGWMRLPAVMVHKEFRDRVWDATQERLGTPGSPMNAMQRRLLERWAERCRIELRKP